MTLRLVALAATVAGLLSLSAAPSRAQAAGTKAAGAAAPAAGGRTLPWKAGDAPPRFAGLTLGMKHKAILAALGAPDSSRTTQPGARELIYIARGLRILERDADGVAMIYARKPEAAVLDSIRVGDSRDRVRDRWGQPPSVTGQLAIYPVGKWAVIVRLRNGGTDVVELGVGVKEGGR